MAWFHQAISHYLSLCWPRPMLPYGATRPRWDQFTIILQGHFPGTQEIIRLHQYQWSNHGWYGWNWSAQQNKTQQNTNCMQNSWYAQYISLTNKWTINTTVVITKLMIVFTKNNKYLLHDPGIILYMCPANERQHYIATSSLIGWAHSQNDPCMTMWIKVQ